jgi:hypothetical protein
LPFASAGAASSAAGAEAAAGSAPPPSSKSQKSSVVCSVRARLAEAISASGASGGSMCDVASACCSAWLRGRIVMEKVSENNNYIKKGEEGQEKKLNDRRG